MYFEPGVDLRVGCMFSGKTSDLLAFLYTYQMADLKIQAFYPALDDRYGDGHISSHNNLTFPATALVRIEQVYDYLDPEVKILGFDEVQFYDDAVVQVFDELAYRGILVAGAGLNLDFRGEPFGAMPELMTRADIVHTFKGICKKCKKRHATRTQRMIDGRPAFYDDPIVLVGGSDSYEARCRECHQVPHRS